MSTETKKPKISQIDRARAYVGKMNAAIEGSGGDEQTFIVACKLVEFGLNQSDAMTVLLEYNQRCQPPWEEKPLARKLKCAFRSASPSPDFAPGIAPQVFTESESEKMRKWPKENAGQRLSIVSAGIALSDLYDLSPCKFSDDRKHAVEILNLLFPGNPLVCCGKSSSVFWTRPLNDFGRQVESFQLIVPNPMSALMGKLQDPEPGGPTESAHTKDNTGERRFAVIEFDHGSSDEHSALLWHLSTYAPLAMAVHSGGKSLHGWFYVEGSPEDRVLRFYRYAVSIGADRATFLKSQFVRMPDGQRSNGARQCVYYLNPSVIPCLKT